MRPGDRSWRDMRRGVSQSFPLSGERTLTRPPREGERQSPSELRRVGRVSTKRKGHAAAGTGDMRQSSSTRGLWILSGDERPSPTSGAPCGEGGMMPVGEGGGIGTWLGLGLELGLGLGLWLRLGLRLGLGL